MPGNAALLVNTFCPSPCCWLPVKCLPFHLRAILSFSRLLWGAPVYWIITSITLQLQRIPSGRVDVLVRSAASLGEIFTIFQEEQSADYLEAWVDGFAGGRCMGRGMVTCTKYSDECDKEFRAINPRTTQSQTSRIQ